MNRPTRCIRPALAAAALLIAAASDPAEAALIDLARTDVGGLLIDSEFAANARGTIDTRFVEAIDTPWIARGNDVGGDKYLALTSFSLAGLNGQYIRSAVLTGTINADDTGFPGNRDVEVSLTPDDGAITPSDVNQVGPKLGEVRVNPSTRPTAAYTFDVTGLVRAARDADAAHLRSDFEPDNNQARSVLDPNDLPTITVDAYATPFDAITGFDGVGLAFFGESGETVTAGREETFTETGGATFTVDEATPGSIRVTVQPAGGGGSWSVELAAAPGQSLEAGGVTAVTETRFSFTGEGRSLTASRADVTIETLRFDAAGQLVELDLTFAQSGAGEDATAYGRLMIPEPGAAGVVLFALVAGGWRRSAAKPRR
jgi:hypothetical protein